MHAVLKVGSASTPLLKRVLPAASQAAQKVGAFEDGDGSPRAGQGSAPIFCVKNLAEALPPLLLGGPSCFQSPFAGQQHPYSSQVFTGLSRECLEIDAALDSFYKTKSSVSSIPSNEALDIINNACKVYLNLRETLPESHLRALVAYSSQDFHASIQQYRNLLRGQQKPNCRGRFALQSLSQFVPVLKQALCSAIPLLPRRRHLILHRNTKMSWSRVSEILEHKTYIVPEKSIQSTTAVGRQIFSKGNVDMVIFPAEEGEQIEAADLCGLTKHPKEEEHFLIPGTQLQLVGYEQNKQDRPGLPGGLEELNNHGTDFPNATLYFRCTHVPPQETMP
jgi:hypothetical protein